jgi:hypothetical protein
LFASLSRPQLHGIATAGDRIFVQCRSSLLVFDQDGRFVQERKLQSVGSALLLGVREDGQLWMMEGSEDSTTFHLLSPSDELLFKKKLSGQWTGFLRADGQLFVGQVRDQELLIDELDWFTDSQSRYVTVPVKRPFRMVDLSRTLAVHWVVHSEGDVYVLSTWREKGTVTRYARTGDPLNSWEVTTEPVTSVAYLNGIHIDSHSNIYVTHSSWEVSSAPDREGSVVKYDSEGRFQYRATEGVSYLREIAVSDKGDLYLINLGDRVLKYAPDGEFVENWIAVPPRFGETWEERRRLAARASLASSSSSTEDLILAVIYGSSFPAREELLKRGAEVIPDVAQSLVRFRESYLSFVLENLCRANSEEAVSAFEESSPTVKRLLAVPVAWAAQEPVPGLREILTELVREGDDNARYALAEVGTPTEIVEDYIEDVRRVWDSGDRAFDAESKLRTAYPDAQAALGRFLQDPTDRHRHRFRRLILDASADYRVEALVRPEYAEDELPRRVLDATLAWLESDDSFVVETAAIALSGFGIPGHEAEALRSLERSAELLEVVFQALQVLGRAHPQRVDVHAQKLGEIARIQRSSQAWPNPLGAMLKIGTPGVVDLGWGLLQDESLPANYRAGALFGVEVERVPRSKLEQSLGEPRWFRPLARSSGLYSFLEEVTETFVTNGAMLDTVRSLLVDILKNEAWRSVKTRQGNRSDSRALQDVLGAMDPVFTAAEVTLVLPFASDTEGDKQTRYLALRLLSRVPPTRESRPILIDVLDDVDFRLQAAKSLGRIGYPGALEILIDDGLKKAGSYSWVKLDEESFQPYGRQAEEKLLSLLSYPDKGTQRLARVLLGKMRSDEGIRIIKGELTTALKAGDLPPGGVLIGLIAAGEDPLSELVDLLADDPEALRRSSFDLACQEGRGYLERSLLGEENPQRARTLAAIIQLGCSREAEMILENVSSRHPVESVREAISKRSVRELLFPSSTLNSR